MKRVTVALLLYTQYSGIELGMAPGCSHATNTIER